MARKADKRAQSTANGVNGDGGSESGAAASGSTGSEQPGGGSGDGSGDDGNGVVRPSLNGNGDGDGNGDGGAGSGEPRRGRGRPAGSRSHAKKAEISVTTLAEVIAFAHVGIATVFKNDAWSLDDGESKKLADAAAKVLRHHDTPAFSAYAMDWIGLLMVMGNVYGPRIAVTVANKTAPAPREARTPQQPKEPTTAQEDGFVVISHPDGSGRTVRVPVQN